MVYVILYINVNTYKVYRIIGWDESNSNPIFIRQNRSKCRVLQLVLYVPWTPVALISPN